jgi:hypothetical protein
VQLAPRDFIEPIDLKQDVAWDQWHDLISAEDLTEEMEHIMMKYVFRASRLSSLFDVLFMFSLPRLANLFLRG